MRLKTVRKPSSARAGPTCRMAEWCAGANMKPIPASRMQRAMTSLPISIFTPTALGVKIDIGSEVIARCIREAGIGFMFAPAHHSAMRHVGPARAELGFRTVFNLIGPLSNPASVRRYLLGAVSYTHLTLP